jgi:hypothetical protein
VSLWINYAPVSNHAASGWHLIAKTARMCVLHRVTLDRVLKRATSAHKSRSRVAHVVESKSYVHTPVLACCTTESVRTKLLTTVGRSVYLCSRPHATAYATDWWWPSATMLARSSRTSSSSRSSSNKRSSNDYWPRSNASWRKPTVYVVSSSTMSVAMQSTTDRSARSAGITNAPTPTLVEKQQEQHKQ